MKTKTVAIFELGSPTNHILSKYFHLMVPNNRHVIIPIGEQSLFGVGRTMMKAPSLDGVGPRKRPSAIFILASSQKTSS
jgi:hypothetical protein